MPACCANMRVDVLVIGIGPAGASAARLAAASGLSVLAIDKRHAIGEPVQCAEYVPAPLAAYTREAGVKMQSITEMTSQYNFVAEDVCEFRGVMINRARFDQNIAQQAQENGANLWLQTYLLALDAERHMASLHNTVGTINIHYKLLIAADGPKSRVARLLGFKSLTIMDTRQYTLTLQQQSHTTRVWLSARFPAGYAWLFPVGANANLGIGSDATRRVELKHHLDALHAELRRQGTVGAEVLSCTGGPIPIAGIRNPLTAVDTVFVGDAAGLTHPVTGAGIAAAVMSGELAGQAAISQLQHGDLTALAQYEESIRDLFATSILHGLRNRARLTRYRQQQGGLSSDILRQTWIASPDYYIGDNTG